MTSDLQAWVGGCIAGALAKAGHEGLFAFEVHVDPRETDTIHVVSRSGERLVITVRPDGAKP